ncbi:OadG family transporter subunit [Pisciglobus halotolerans]|uniref:Oxaloacetate decarboxylase, gamma chain n=1 Tax=Pisciglobus halotolerans TaxID=745365 RepID=A0A1I3E2V1_9LACT|nr:OadG family transporter subunit [Pisciglobus halotolerans]SFH93317.1 Oxaloacetate decarboxylase, gamma chain [Pisciglobus halotolerans]
MGAFTLFDGLVVSVVSIIMVFIVLFGLQLLIGLFRLVGKEDTATEQVLTETKEHTKHMSTEELEEDEESRMVATLMALVMANEDKQDHQYRITEIKRIH